MKLYLMRHAETEGAEAPDHQMDPTRDLTDKGVRDAHMMSAFLSRQASALDVVITSDFLRTKHTAEIMAELWSLPVITTQALEPAAKAADEWQAIKYLAKDAKHVLVVGHGPALRDLFSYLTSPHHESGDGAGFELIHGSIWRLDTDAGWFAEVKWGITPEVLTREKDDSEITEAADALCELLEKRGEYTYEEIEVKRLILGDGGESGNCEYCEEAADEGWIDMDGVFEGPMGDEDEPPLHPNCTCSVEYATKRRRVYA